ncbi:MAG TPA: hypothetical protein VL633_06240 [Bacteroidota bacterium]|jgi:hypothetical protein|nr:hypothetical protein [Bacteroidota bacterium]
MDLFQTSLYFFSSLLQADAALLGFGTVIIIFKLQSLETVRQSIIQTYYTKGPGHTSNMNSLILSRNPAELAKTLDGMKENQYDYRNYEFVVLIPAKSDEIRRSIRLPVLVTSSHAVVCSLLLLIAQYLYSEYTLQFIMLAISLLWFAWLVVLASRLAISLLTAQDKFELRNLLPEVHQAMNAIIEKKKTKPSAD